jgi:hypothetical protein
MPRRIFMSNEGVEKEYDEAKNQYPCGGILLSSIRGGLQEESGIRTASAAGTNYERECAATTEASDFEFHGIACGH